MVGLFVSTIEKRGMFCKNLYSLIVNRSLNKVGELQQHNQVLSYL